MDTNHTPQPSQPTASNPVIWNNADDYSDVAVYVKELGGAEWKFSISLSHETNQIEDSTVEYAAEQHAGFDETGLTPSDAVQHAFQAMRPTAVDMLEKLKRTKAGGSVLWPEIFQLPSMDGHGEYDRLVLIPSGTDVEKAKTSINDIIHDVNREDHESENGGCLDGNSVEENIQRRIDALGYKFMKPLHRSLPWDDFDPDYQGRDAK